MYRAKEYSPAEIIRRLQKWAGTGYLQNKIRIYDRPPRLDIEIIRELPEETFGPITIPRNDEVRDITDKL
ncbi:MAG: hypothetical protein ABIJ18_05500 [archaeon]